MFSNISHAGTCHVHLSPKVSFGKQVEGEDRGALRNRVAQTMFEGLGLHLHAGTDYTTSGEFSEGAAIPGTTYFSHWSGTFSTKNRQQQLDVSLQSRIKFPGLSRSRYNSVIVIQKAVPLWGSQPMPRGTAPPPPQKSWRKSSSLM